MTQTTFNSGWKFGKKMSIFSEIAGQESSAWATVVLPHDAMLRQPRVTDDVAGGGTGHFPAGAYQYKKTFAAPSSFAGQVVTLVFEGVYRYAGVYVNGTLAGRNASGYSEFRVRIDPYLNFGADNEITVECRTGKDARWYSGAGIYRDVHLEVKPAIHLSHVLQVTTPLVESDEATVEIVSEVRNDGPLTRTVRVAALIESHAEDAEIVDWADAPVTVLPGERATVRHRLTVENPRLWSEDNPALYRAAVELRTEPGDEPVDSEATNFGVRTVHADARHGLRINGRPVNLRGACVHHDSGVLGAATFAEAEERRVRILKDAGFNAIRSAHNPVSRAMLDACDRLGVFVMDEAFDQWTLSKIDEDYSVDFPQWWEHDIESMVLKDINRPSVILYSIGNEIPENGTPFGGALSRRIAEKIRALDPHRLITNGINGFVATLDEVLAAAAAQADADAPEGGVNTMMAQLGDVMDAVAVSESVTRRTEESQSVLDVAGMNYAEARYEIDRDLFPKRVIVGTESFPTKIDRIWSLVESNEHVIGDFTWTGWDYIGEVGIGGVDYQDPNSRVPATIARAYPWLLAHTGDIDITGHRRPASYYREIVFGRRSEPYIAVQRPQRHGQEIAFASPWAWTDTVSSWSWAGSEGSPVDVEVYSPADEVALVLNGEVIARANVGTSRAYRADFTTVYRPGTLEAVAYTGGVETGRTRLRTADTAGIVLRHSDPSGELIYVEITIEDEHGTVATGEDIDVTITVEGEAVLLGYGTARPQSEAYFLDSSHRTFDGRALAVLRRTRRGPVRITAADTSGRIVDLDLPTSKTPGRPANHEASVASPAI